MIERPVYPRDPWHTPLLRWGFVTDRTNGSVRGRMAWQSKEAIWALHQTTQTTTRQHANMRRWVGRRGL
jgi:hypothetical protein